MNIELLAQKYGIGIKRVYPEDCQLCIAGYTGKKCRYLIRIKNKSFCIREAVKNDPRLRF